MQLWRAELNREWEKMVSVIIPVYNGFKGLDSVIIKSKISKEILLIDDGSEDDSARKCAALAKKYPEIKFISKKHTGVSDTRNVGIRSAKGKYILFLDSDDTLKPGSIDILVQFFEMCYEAVDLVTYPIETLYKGYFLPPHFRYKTMTYSGIYDLNILPYIGQTTMNIIVKNLGKDNILFDTEMNFSEDQMYCCDVLQRKMKIGFCKEAAYIYHRSDDSSSGQLNGACYIFEQSMHMFETLFARYDKQVPKAIQGLYITDLSWKLRCNVLYPYHYEKKAFENAIERIHKLLNKVDSEIIWNHPEIDRYHKFYWLSQKSNSGVSLFCEHDRYGLRHGKNILIEEREALIVISRIRREEDNLIFRGFLKSGIFSFSKQPELYAIAQSLRIKLSLFSSAHSYYLCHTKTNNFFSFCLELPIQNFEELRFEMKLEGKSYPCKCDFLPKAPFSMYYQRRSVIIKGIRLGYDKEKKIFFKDTRAEKEILADNSNDPCLTIAISRLRRKAVKLRNNHNIQLYLDCRGVEKDNGYYQFLKDFNKKDGIERYYIVDSSNHRYYKLFNHAQRKAVILFGSYKHRLYTLAASRLITAYIEDNNLLPFKTDEIPMVSDFFDFTVEYLQHGILHASMPWKYTPEVIMADKVCISTIYERDLFTKKNHFREQDLISRLMPRLEQLDQTVKPSRKILFAPSWRSYLVGDNINGKWQPRKETFLRSDYFINIVKFLNASELHEWLVSNNYLLKFKLHPIFEAYKELFPSFHERIEIIQSTEKIEQYEIFITDFSSYMFDFIYLDRLVFSFIPDEIQFRCGMNNYREIEPESEMTMIKVENAQDFCEAVNDDMGKTKHFDFYI